MSLKENLNQLLVPSYPLKKISDKKTSQYYFKCWGTDELDGITFYYWFWSKTKNKKNEKRIIFKEFEALIFESIKSGRVSRYDFNQLCPRTNQSGPCGFAVILSIISDIAGVRRFKNGVFEIINIDKLVKFAS